MRVRLFDVQEVALSLFQEVEDRFKDYIKRPKANGYQSLHMTLRLPLSQRPDGQQYEFWCRPTTTLSATDSSAGGANGRSTENAAGAALEDEEGMVLCVELKVLFVWVGLVLLAFISCFIIRFVCVSSFVLCVFCRGCVSVGFVFFVR